MLSAYAIDLRLSAHYKNIYQLETLQHRPLLTKMSKFEQELLIFLVFRDLLQQSTRQHTL